MSLKDNSTQENGRQTQKMTVETVETVVAAAPYGGADWPQAATVTVGQPISAR